MFYLHVLSLECMYINVGFLKLISDILDLTPIKLNQASKQAGCLGREGVGESGLTYKVGKTFV